MTPRPALPCPRSERRRYPTCIQRDLEFPQRKRGPGCASGPSQVRKGRDHQGFWTQIQIWGPPPQPSFTALQHLPGDGVGNSPPPTPPSPTLGPTCTHPLQPSQSVPDSWISIPEGSAGSARHFVKLSCHCRQDRNPSCDPKYTKCPKTKALKGKTPPGSWDAFQVMDKRRMALMSLSELGNSWMKTHDKREFSVVISSDLGWQLFAVGFRQLLDWSLSSEAT